MGMTLEFVRLSQSQLAELESLGGEESLEFWYRPELQAQTLDIQKEWEILDFALCGECAPFRDEIEPLGDGERLLEIGSNPLHQVVYGVELTPYEASYGLMRLIPALHVMELSSLLAAVDEDQFLVNFKKAQPLRLYAQHPGDAAANWKILQSILASVRTFFAVAAREKQMIFVALH